MNFFHGHCCACGIEKSLRNMICLELRAPVPGTGWGCFQCHVPQDGALALLCDECLQANAPVRFVCDGPAQLGGRKPIGELTEPFGHNMTLHPEERLH